MPRPTGPPTLLFLDNGSVVVCPDLLQHVAPQYRLKEQADERKISRVFSEQTFSGLELVFEKIIHLIIASGGKSELLCLTR